MFENGRQERALPGVLSMQVIEEYLLNIVYFFSGNWIASGILAVVIIVMAIKKTELLLKVTGGIVLVVGVLYIMIFLEQSMFSGVSSKERSYEVERQLK